jgi:DNA-binding response OmpR family regulator
MSTNIHYKPRLLIADDNRDTLTFLQLILCREEYSCDLAEDGAQAIGAWEVARGEGYPYQLLVLDAAMPHKSGFEVAEHVRQVGGDSETPIIIITGDCEPMMRPHAEYVQASDIIFKPFDPETLKQKVADLLAARATHVAQPE